MRLAEEIQYFLLHRMFTIMDEIFYVSGVIVRQHRYFVFPESRADSFYPHWLLIRQTNVRIFRDFATCEN